jgi:hypothetical protein
MGFFGPKKKYYYAIKLYKIVDGVKDREFSSSELVEKLIEYFHKEIGLDPNYLNINYQKEFKTLVGFRTAMKKHSEPDLVYIGFDSDKTKCLFSLNNPVTYSNDKPQNSLIDLVICIGEEYFSSDKCRLLIKELLQDYDFEYGYVQRFHHHVSHTSERKMRVNVFYTSSTGHPIDGVWNSHSIGIRYGYLRKLYNINYLNRSQFDDTDLKIFIDRFGTKELISENILCWTISDKNIEELMKEPIMQSKLIQFDLDKNQFVKSDDAKRFNLLMKQPTGNGQI